jgi:hypothetical protein
MPPKLNLTDEQLQAIVVARKVHNNWDMTLEWFRDKYKQTVVTDSRQLQRKFNTMMKKREAKGKEVKDKKKGGNKRDGPINQWAGDISKSEDDEDDKSDTDVKDGGDVGKAAHTETTTTDTTAGGHENKNANNEYKTPPRTPPSPPPSPPRQPDDDKAGDGTRTNSNPNHNPNPNLTLTLTRTLILTRSRRKSTKSKERVEKKNIKIQRGV